MASGSDKKTGIQWGIILIALLAALLVLLLAGWLDAYLVETKEVAAATFNFTPMLWVQIGVRLVMASAWFGLAWLVLFSLALPRLSSLLLLALGLFVLLSAYVGLLAGLPVARLRWVSLTNDFVNFTGAFITVLGLVILVAKPASSQQPIEGDESEG